MSKVSTLPPAISNGVVRILHSRRLMRSPIWLYRARLGFLFGKRMMMLEHIGRKSGVPRHVVLEVFGHPAPDTYVVVSAFGDRSQWFRNVEATPGCRVATGPHGLAPATARTLGQAEADAVLAAYASKHQRAWKAFKPALETTLGTMIDDQNTALPMVEFRIDKHGRGKARG